MSKIHLFLNGKKTPLMDMLTCNGDLIINNPIKANATIKRNEIWYATITFPKKILHGIKLTQESVFRLDLGSMKKQLFRMIYPKENKLEGTYECYCSHIFFDARFEALPIDSIKCINNDDNEYQERWTWEQSIEKLNLIGTTCLGVTTPYKIEGSNPEPLLFDTTPEPGEFFKIIWRDNQNKAWDVGNGGSNSSSPIQMHDNYYSAYLGFNPNQNFVLTKSKSGIEGEYCIRNYKSFLYTNINGGVVKDGAVLMIYKGSNDAPHERFTFEKLPNGGCKIHSAKDPNFCISRGQENWNNVQLCMRRSNDTETAMAYLFQYSYNKQSIDFSEQNLIESLFGTNEKKSMKEGFKKLIDKHHVTAMFNNYTCYFGNMNLYPERYRPKEYIIPSKYINKDIQKETTEERVDAIIPIGYNNKRAPSNDARSFVKSTDYDKHSVHHVQYVKYDKLKLKSDGGDIVNEDALWEALYGKAKADLDSGTITSNIIESDLELVDFIRSGNPMFKDLKINDILCRLNDKGEKERFFIESYTYDICEETIKKIQIVKDGD